MTTAVPAPSTADAAPTLTEAERYAKEAGLRQLFPDAPRREVLEDLKEGERVIVVGDVHGCLDELRALLAACEFKEGADTVVLLGDLVGKGPASLQVVDFARRLPRCRVLLGNHDWTLLRWYEAQRNAHGSDTDSEVAVPFSSPTSPYKAMAAELSQEQYEYIKSWPLRIDIPRDNVVCVHAGVDPTTPACADGLPATNGFDLMHMRNVVTEETVVAAALSATPDTPPPPHLLSEALPGTAWASLYAGPAHVVFGHDAKRRLQQHPHATGLDTGCCYGNELTALVLPARRVVSVESGVNCLAEKTAAAAATVVVPASS